MKANESMTRIVKQGQIVENLKIRERKSPSDWHHCVADSHDGKKSGHIRDIVVYGIEQLNIYFKKKYSEKSNKNTWSDTIKQSLTWMHNWVRSDDQTLSVISHFLISQTNVPEKPYKSVYI